MHEFELENGSKQTRECTGIVLEVSKENEWRDNRRARRKFKAGEAAKILWDSITDCGTTIDSEESIVALDPKKWEKMTVVGGWRADVGSIVVEYKQNHINKVVFIHLNLIIDKSISYITIGTYIYIITKAKF